MNRLIILLREGMNTGFPPSWAVWTQSICFFVLYSIWYYPNTNFLSDLAIVVGALTSVYIIFLNIRIFKTKEAIAFWMIVALLAWVVLHLFFLSNDLHEQLKELKSIWKRVLMVMVYGLGFGVGLSAFKSVSKCLLLIYFGMLMPGLIYIFKYTLGIFANQIGIVLPEYLMLYYQPISSFFIYKTAYTIALIPAFAASIGSLQCILERTNHYSSVAMLMVGCTLSYFVFDTVNIKNAVIYAFIITIVFLMIIAINFYKDKIYSIPIIKKYSLIAFLVALLALMAVSHSMKENPSWNSLFADAKVGLQVELQPKWKYFGGNGFPLNENGNVVSVTNYYRTSWAIIGLRLLGDNPLGYGLVYRSFAKLTSREWPESNLDQAHSGWLDLALGIGIPGVILIITAILIALYCLVKIARIKLISANQRTLVLGMSWILFSLILIWTTSEVSQGINLIQLIFWICMGVGVAAGVRVSLEK